MSKAARARDLLDNDAAMEAFQAVADAYRNAALMADAKDDLGRYRLAEAEKIVWRVREHIQGIAAGEREAEDAPDDFYRRKRKHRLF